VSRTRVGLSTPKLPAAAGTPTRVVPGDVRDDVGCPTGTVVEGDLAIGAHRNDDEVGDGLSTLKFRLDARAGIERLGRVLTSRYPADRSGILDRPTRTALPGRPRPT